MKVRLLLKKLFRTIVKCELGTVVVALPPYMFRIQVIFRRIQKKNKVYEKQD